MTPLKNVALRPSGSHGLIGGIQPPHPSIHPPSPRQPCVSLHIQYKSETSKVNGSCWQSDAAQNIWGGINNWFVGGGEGGLGLGGGGGVPIVCFQHAYEKI